MEVQVPAARVEEAVEARLRDLGRTVKLQGFRAGKVPAQVVKQRFGGQVHQEVVEELVKRSFAEAAVQQKLSPAGSPRIEPVSSLAGQDLQYTAIFEVYPEIKLSGIDSLKIDRPVVEVTDKDVDTMLDHLRRQRPSWKAVSRAAKDGDRVTMDFEGRLDGVPFEGGKAEDIPVVIGGGRMLPDLEQGLIGLTEGMEKQVTVNFPAEYQAANLAGKTTEFTVKAKKIEEPELPPLDDEFCKSFGIEGGIEEFRKQITQNMRNEVEQGTRNAMRNQVLERLVAANKVELPKSLVDAQVNEMQVDWGRRSGVYDVSKIPPRETFEESARRRVSLGLLIGEVVRSQDLKADPQRLDERLLAVAANAHDQHGHHHSDAREHQQHVLEIAQSYRRNPQAMSQIESMVLEDQAIEWLLSQAKTVDQPKTFKEFTNFGEER